MASLSAKIPSDDKEKIQVLIDKGMFSSMSDFCRTAISRLLRDIEEYKEKKKQMKKELFQAEEKVEERVEEDLEELQRFIDDLY
ncbi:MAG: hypothetical protein V3T58_06420 [Candidatus Hydrothermarchaeales archaeon]